MKTLLAITFSDIALVVSPILSAAIAWLIARKKNDAELRKIDAETDMMEIKNLQKVMDIWKGMVNDLSVEVTKMRAQVLAFTVENTQLKQEIGELKQEIRELKKLSSDQQVNNS